MHPTIFNFVILKWNNKLAINWFKYSAPTTFYGLAGVGDLVATCTSKYSRNRFVGERLAQGKSMEEIKKGMHGMVAEGVQTTKSVYEFAKKHKLNMPLTQQAYCVLYENKNIKNAIKDLLKSFS